MSQAWLQVIGLMLDMAGFSLILWEWVLAQRHDLRVRELEALEARQAENMRHLQRIGGPQPAQLQQHYEMAAQSRRRLADRRLEEVGSHYRGVRMLTVYCGAAAVVAGFIAQILAAWPDCCRLLGIVPGG